MPRVGPARPRASSAVMTVYVEQAPATLATSPSRAHAHPQPPANCAEQFLIGEAQRRCHWHRRHRTGGLRPSARPKPRPAKERPTWCGSCQRAEQQSAFSLLQRVAGMELLPVGELARVRSSLGVLVDWVWGCELCWRLPLDQRSP